MKKIFIPLLSLLSILSYNGHAQTTEGTIVNEGSNTVEVFANPSSTLSGVSFSDINITISFTSQGASNPTAAQIIATSLVSNLAIQIVNTNSITPPCDSFVLAGRVYYTYLLTDNSNGLLTTWTTGVSNPVASFQFTFDPTTVSMELNDQSVGGINQGGGLATDPSSQSYWYVQLTSGDITNYTTMFYGTGATNTAAATPSFVPLQLSDPLPVKFITFTATLQNDDALLNWVVSNEGTGAKDYEVQKSIDNGASYTTIATVDITNPNAASNTYSYTDSNLSLVKSASNVIYYRIKQVDNNNIFTLSSTEIIQLPSKVDATVSVYPNPVQDVATVKFDLDEDQLVTMNLTDLSGRVLQSQQLQGTIGENKPTVNMTSLVNGNYVLSLNIGGVPHIFPLVKAD
jgi:type IX secretion system substrate protein